MPKACSVSYPPSTSPRGWAHEEYAPIAHVIYAVDSNRRSPFLIEVRIPGLIRSEGRLIRFN
eukprot:6856493-Prymnesium_polylepis.4